MNKYSTCLAATLSAWVALLLFTQVAIGQTNQPSAAPASRPVDENAVFIPVVVRDAQGRVVGTLPREDFEVFDQGKRQVVSAFTIEKRPSIEFDAKPVELPSADVPVSVPAAPPSTPERTVAADRSVVFLFDDLHLSVADATQVQKVAASMLAESLAASDMAAVVSFSGINTGMTHDRTKLQDAIAKLRGRDPQTGSQCPNVDYYLADLITNQRDDKAFELALQDALNCTSRKPDIQKATQHLESAVAQSLAVGDRDVRFTLAFVKELVGKMDTFSGQRTLILVSPGFLATSAEAMALKSEIMDLAAQTDVIISALGTRALYGDESDANQKLDAAHRGLKTEQEFQYYRDSLRIDEDVMAELADGTGGTYFASRGELKDGFRSLAAAPEYLYLLQISPRKSKPNGTYHRLKIKLRPGSLNLHARRGYFVPKAKTSQADAAPRVQGTERTRPQPPIDAATMGAVP